MRLNAHPQQSAPAALSGQVTVDLSAISEVCMDQFMVHLGPWGAAIGSHGDEIINRIAPRLPRSYSGAAAHECPDYQEPASAGVGRAG